MNGYECIGTDISRDLIISRLSNRFEVKMISNGFEHSY